MVLTAFAIEAILARGDSVATRFSNRAGSAVGSGPAFVLGTVLTVAVMAVLRLKFLRGKAMGSAVLNRRLGWLNHQPEAAREAPSAQVFIGL